MKTAFKIQLALIVFLFPYNIICAQHLNWIDQYREDYGNFIISLKKLTSVQYLDSLENSIINKSKLLISAEEVLGHSVVDTNEIILEKFLLLDSLDNLCIIIMYYINLNSLEFVIYDSSSGYLETAWRMDNGGLNYLILNHYQNPKFQSPEFLLAFYFVLNYSVNDLKIFSSEIYNLKPDSMFLDASGIKYIKNYVTNLKTETVLDSANGVYLYEIPIFTYGMIPRLYKISGKYQEGLFLSMDVEEIEY